MGAGGGGFSFAMHPHINIMQSKNQLKSQPGLTLSLVVLEVVIFQNRDFSIYFFTHHPHFILWPTTFSILSNLT